MSNLTHMTIVEANAGLVAKDFTAVELTQAHLDAMEKQRAIGAYITEIPELALAEAAESDRRLAMGKSLPLDGIPLGIKDLFCTKGVQTTAASRILKGFIPPYESTVTANLKRAGSVTLGKLNLDEFAMGSSNMTSYFGAVKNPWTPKSNPESVLVPGGSSGGSAAAVAARIAMGATGTDTGGSIRQPAAFCGVVGIKPTYGRCSRFGTIAFASSLDQAGPMARTVEDCALMLSSMAGYDPKDSTSANRPVPDFTKALTGDIRGLKVGIPKEYRPEGLSSEVEAIWQQGMVWLKDAGAEIVDISLPHTQYALPTYYILAPAEASSNLARYDGLRYGLRVEDGKTLDDMYRATRAVGFGAEVRRRIMIGTYVLSAGYYDAYYTKAQRVRRLISQDFLEAQKQVDVILTPTTPSPAFVAGENMDDPVTMWLNDIFTIPSSLAGLPGLSLPAGLNGDGLPLGLQLIGRPFDEETVFKVAHIMEKAAGFSASPNLNF